MLISMRWLVGIVLLLLAACRPATPAAGGKLRVVATYSILGDWVQQVGGDHIELQVLVGADSDAHTFEPSPADGVRLADAQLVFENGLDFEPWLNDFYSATHSQAVRIAVGSAAGTAAGTTIEAQAGTVAAPDDEHGEESHDEHDEASHAHEVDPHIWHSVPNAIAAVKIIQAELSALDPAHASSYASNAERYLAELETLDRWIREQVATIPTAQRKLVTTHDTFGYFADTYGLTVLGTALGSTSTESGNASAAALAALVTEIRAAGVPAIFAENVHNPAVMAQVAREANVVLAPTLYTDALGTAGSAGDSYLKLMRYNVQTITNALR